MQIREIYTINNKIGVLGASSPREYIDVRGKSKSLPIKTKKRETFIADIQKLSKKVPGPGKYDTNPQDQKYAKKVYRKIDFNAQAKKPRKNFIEQVIKQKKSIPGVGKYELVLQKNDKIRQWHSILGDKQRKKALLFRNDIFDECNVDCINVAPGSYNTQIPFVKMNKFQTTAPPPKAEDKPKEEKDKKRSNSLPKLPGAQTYHPIPNDYETFEKLLSQKDKDSNHSNFSKNKRFTPQKQKSPGPKYSLIAEWSPKNNSMSKKKGINIFKSMSNLRSPSVYY